MITRIMKRARLIRYLPTPPPSFAATARGPRARPPRTSSLPNYEVFPGTAIESNAARPANWSNE
jgi:hypothetical protein